MIDEKLCFVNPHSGDLKKDDHGFDLSSESREILLDKALRVLKRDSEGVVIDIDDSDNGEEENDRDDVDDQALCVLKRDSEGEVIVIDDSDSEEEVPLKCMVLKR